MTTEQKEYNGHPSRAHWNVALWFGNDYGLYRLALACKSGKELLERCKETGFVKTPDGYTLTERLCQHAWECVNE